MTAPQPASQAPPAVPIPRWLERPRRADFAAFFAGCLTPLAFAPFGVFPLAVLAPMLLFLVWRGARPGRAAWRGFLYGLGAFGIGVSWVYVSLHDFGFMPLPLAAFATLLFVAGLALYPALLGFVQARVAWLPAGLHLALALPALWVFGEWFRGWFLSGFPWLNLGYSQSNSWLAGYAPLAGVYGVSLIVALSAGLLAAMVYDRRRALRFYLPALVLLWAGGFAASHIRWVEPTGNVLRVALVQGNIALAQKWQPDYRPAIVDRYVHLSERAGKVDLIVWPEAALPGHLAEFGPTLLPRLTQLAQTQGADLVFGLVEYDAGARRYYNSVMRIGVGPATVYRKRHLVPFGEFLPWPALFGGVIQYLQIPMSNFAAGAPAQPALRAANQPLAVSVCYEDAFGEELLTWLPQASLMLNVSEDAWFGNSLAPHQRLQMAQLRALEAGRPMVRAANTGPSAAIDHTGTVLRRSPQFEPQVLVAQVQPMRGATPYARFGNVPIVGLLGLLLAGAVVAGWRVAWCAR